jgi:hypothetical protein
VLRFGFLLLPASTYRSGPKVFAFLSNVDDSHQPYAAYIPDQVDPNPRNFRLLRSCHRTLRFIHLELELLSTGKIQLWTGRKFSDLGEGYF